MKKKIITLVLVALVCAPLNATRKHHRNGKKGGRGDKGSTSQRRYAARIGAGAPVYLAAVLEYLTSECISGDNAARSSSRYIQLAVSNDEELEALLARAQVALFHQPTPPAETPKASVTPPLPLEEKDTSSDS